MTYRPGRTKWAGRYRNKSRLLRTIDDQRYGAARWYTHEVTEWVGAVRSPRFMIARLRWLSHSLWVR